MCALYSVFCVESTKQAQRLQTGFCLHNMNGIVMSKKSYDSGPKYRSNGDDCRIGAERFRWISVQTVAPLCPSVQSHSHKPWKIREASVMSFSTMPK